MGQPPRRSQLILANRRWPTRRRRRGRLSVQPAKPARKSRCATTRSANSSASKFLPPHKNKSHSLQSQTSDWNLKLSADGPVATKVDGLLVPSSPPFRVDLKREVDLIEEVARLFGMENIPVHIAARRHRFQRLRRRPRSTCRSPPYSYRSRPQRSPGPDTYFRRIPPSSSSGEPVALQNPLSSDMDALRPSLLPGLLDALRHNLNRKNNDVALFEIGPCVRPQQRPGPRRTPRRHRPHRPARQIPSFWSGDDRAAKFDIYDLKGLLEEFLGAIRHARLHLRPPRREHHAPARIRRHPTRQTIPLGELGQLLPALARRYDLRDAVLASPN